MFINSLINKFGYSEMYEWSELFKYDIIPYGRFVTFDEQHPGQIKIANKDDYPIGVTTINTTIVSDDPDYWNGKYLCNEYGDTLLKQKVVTVDNTDRLQYIPVINEAYDNNKEYVKRSDRKEWIRVNLLGKCIVVDNGECQPGQLCRVGENGIAIPVETSNNWPYVNKFFVIGRLTDHTIMIFYK